MTTRTKMICQRCGSEDVRHDAWAEWDFDHQEWTLAETFDYAHCNNCDGECTIDAVDADDTDTDTDTERGDDEAILPDGSRSPWDERLRTIGATRVRKAP